MKKRADQLTFSLRHANSEHFGTIDMPRKDPSSTDYSSGSYATKLRPRVALHSAPALRTSSIFPASSPAFHHQSLCKSSGRGYSAAGAMASEAGVALNCVYVCVCLALCLCLLYSLKTGICKYDKYR